VHGEVALEAVQFKVVPVEVVALATNPVGAVGADVQPGGVELLLPLPQEGSSVVPVITSHSISSAVDFRFRVVVRPLNVNPIKTIPETGIQINPYRMPAGIFVSEYRFRSDGALPPPDDAA
jgi:hypothetical protein